MYGATGVRSLMAGMLRRRRGCHARLRVRPRAGAQHRRAREVDAGEREPGGGDDRQRR